MEPLFPSLAGRCLSTAPPGKLFYSLFKWTIVLLFFIVNCLNSLYQLVPDIFGTRDWCHWKTGFLWIRGWEWFQNNSNVLHLLCTLFLLLLHQPHLTSSDIISLNLGLPALNILVSNPFFGHIVGRFFPVSKWPFV